MFHQKFHWTKLVLVAIMLIGFLDIKRKLETMIIEQIELTNDFELIFGSYFINHYQGNLQICRFFCKIKASTT